MGIVAIITIISHDKNSLGGTRTNGELQRGASKTINNGFGII